MRVMGLLGLVLALVIVGLLVKKQMAATRAPLPSLAPAASAPATVRAQSQQVQQQVKEAMDAAMQPQRAMPDDAK
ncbi:MAG: hypothetical protein KBE90_10550 [Ottowia sp.]|jgi:hypothetical protein|uniref:hypothetical protein n=1 Tax=Ottowia sp. TaxID=1898956 RepID=UPI001B444AFF|nr:hypothetical protein [Ottowia sp.]MBP7456101.1 hypothetical protein [Ottowia sp.]MBP7459057.1 hypothetical protein [Ottowia sp.]MBP8861923.1 hypothetical protein [Ottowia sp.]MBP8896121.1 hypothetical protein [Ottowia sp.]MBP9523895.1 hypothetical protein [Ottowia sp.]